MITCQGYEMEVCVQGSKKRFKKQYFLPNADKSDTWTWNKMQWLKLSVEMGYLRGTYIITRWESEGTKITQMLVQEEGWNIETGRVGGSSAIIISQRGAGLRCMFKAVRHVGTVLYYSITFSYRDSFGLNS